MVSRLWPLLVLSDGLLMQTSAQGNSRCWTGRFTYAFCCGNGTNSSSAWQSDGDASTSAGNRDCWDKQRYTYDRCCLTTDEEIPPPPAPDPLGSKKWRVVANKDLGGWMVHELSFFEDLECKNRIKRYARTIDSGHRRNFPASNAFDQWVRGTDEYFWYSDPASAGEAWLGLELARHIQVKCVGLWHNNIPALPVTLQRWDISQHNWVPACHWPVARGGEWAMLMVNGTVVLPDATTAADLDAATSVLHAMRKAMYEQIAIQEATSDAPVEL
mmetsp:Transcript_27793/g.50764  ORF Transcript_27793/g.50764 Transcript_27793/m.50764 type:complete len:272 (+) Transcript_27793:105-920(+)